MKSGSCSLSCSALFVVDGHREIEYPNSTGHSVDDRDQEWQELPESGPRWAATGDGSQKRFWAALLAFILTVAAGIGVWVLVAPARLDPLPESKVNNDKPVETPARTAALFVVSVEPTEATLTSPSDDVFISGSAGSWQVEVRSDRPSIPLIASAPGYFEQRYNLERNSKSQFIQLKLERQKSDEPGLSFGISAHADPVRAVGFFTDGRIASASDDASIRIWSLPEGKLLATLPGHQGPVLSLAISPDDVLLASGGADRTVRIWDVEQKKEVLQISGNAGRIESLTFSPDGTALLYATAADAVLCDVATGKKMMTFTGHQADVSAVIFSHDGKTVVTGSADTTLRLWDAAKGELLASLTGHKGRIRGIAMSKDCNRIVSSSFDGVIHLWSARQGKLVRSFIGHDAAVFGVGFISDSELISVSSDNTVRTWDLLTGEQLALFKGHDDSINAIALSKDGQRAITGSLDGQVIVWNLPAPVERSEPRTIELYAEQVNFQSTSKTVWNMALSENSSWLATACDDRIVRIWDMVSGRAVQTLRSHVLSVYAVCWASGDNRLISATNNGNIYEWECPTWQLQRSWKGHVGAVNALCASWDPLRFFSVGDDGVLVEWLLARVQSGTPLFKTEKPLRCLAVAANLRSVVIGGDNGEIRIGKTEGNAEFVPFEGHEGSVYQVAIDPKEQWVASASADGSVRMWDLATREQLHAWNTDAPMKAVAFSPDGRVVAAGSENAFIYIWDTESHRLVYRIIGHQSYVTDLHFVSPTDLLSSSRDGSCKLWKLPEVK